MSQNANQGGAVMETLNDPSLAVLHAILADFRVGGAELKAVHVDFLDKVCTTIGALAHEKWSIVLFGRTSRTGSPQTNRALAERRRYAVESYLRLKLSSLWVFDVKYGYIPWVEEMTGGKDDEESDFWRSVEVWLFKGPHKMPKPTPPPSQPTRTRPGNDRFKIRMLGGVSVGLKIFAADALFFQIWDEANCLTTFYTYSAVGVGKGLLKSPVSATLRGPWNDFKTTGPVTLMEFGGPAIFSTRGGAWWTWNELTMLGLPGRVVTDPFVLDLETGFTVGVGASTTNGLMLLYPREIMPFCEPP
jgi:hypothetical protein